MKKEDIYIEVTPDTIGSYVAVLEKHGETVGNIYIWEDYKYLTFIHEGSWVVSFGWLKTNANGTKLNWTPQDLDDFLIKEKYARVQEFEKDILATHIHEMLLESNKEKYDRLYEIQRKMKEQNEFDRKIHASDSVFYNNIVTKSEPEYIIKNADGTASSVTLRDDKAVVEMPNGTLRIVDRSNLFKIV